jgi:hypothetical protein
MALSCWTRAAGWAPRATVALAWVLGGRLAWGAAAVDAERPGAVAPPADPWPVAIIERPLTLPRGMAAASLSSQSTWSPGTSSRSYFGPNAAIALHDRVELVGGLPFVLCWDGGSRACTGGSAVDLAYLGLAFALRRPASGGLGVAGGLTASIGRVNAPAEHAAAVWIAARRTLFHRLAFLGRADLSIGWEHPGGPVSETGPTQRNQSRIFWTEEMIWQVVEPLSIFAFGRPYRPIGAPGDESWAMQAGAGVSVAFGPRWQLGAGCQIENVMPRRAWEYLPNAKGCDVSVSVFHLPR